MTRCRRGVLTGAHLDLLGEVFTDVCADFGARLVEFNGEDDHVHLLVAYPSQVAVAAGEQPQGRVLAAAAAALPGPDPPGHLWSPSYFAASAGSAPLAMLAEYIRQQRTPGRPG